jgi:hypothetical protein
VKKGVDLMKITFGLRSVCNVSRMVFGVLSIFAIGGSVTQAQEKRTVFTQDNFHWQAKLAAGQTLEVIGRNGEIEATGAGDESAQVDARRSGHGDEQEPFIEVVEYSDGVTICAVYARNATPGRCHRGGVDSESGGVNLKMDTTNGDIRGRDLKSVANANTTNGSVDVETSEWASGHTTNGHVAISMGKADWTGELELATTNGGITVSLPAPAAFQLHAATTNGNIHTDFPITVVGSFGTKNVSGTVGAGGRELKLATTNGGIELKKSGA